MPRAQPPADIADQIQRRLADQLLAILGRCSLYEAVVATGLRPARVSELRRRKLQCFSIKRLVRLIASQGYDIEIAIRPRRPPIVERRAPAATVVRYDRFGEVRGSVG